MLKVDVMRISRIWESWLAQRCSKGILGGGFAGG